MAPVDYSEKENKNLHHFLFGAYLLLFPFYFIYQIFISLNVIPSFLGGYTSIVSVSLFFPCLLVFLSLLVEKNNGKFLLSTITTYFAFIVLFAVFSLILNGQVIIAKPFLDMSFTIIYWIISIAIFSKYSFQNLAYQKFNFFLAFLILVFVALYSIFKGDVFALLLLFSGNASTSVEGASTYQGIGRSIFFMLLMLMVQSRNIYSLFLISTIALMLLFISGSRTFFAATLLMLGIMTVLYNPRKVLINASILLIAFFPLIAIAYNYFPDFIDELSKSRILEIFNLTQSASWNIRILTFLEGWDIIKNNIFFGNFGHSYYENTSKAHNILFAWSNHGFFGFLLLVIALLTSLFTIASLRISENNHHINFGFALIVVTIFLQIFLEAPSQSFLPGAAIGYTVYLSNWVSKKYDC